jgi:colicin import membrane protein
MPPKENKTADKKAYQAEYRRTHPKSKEDQNEYMKTYIAKAVSVDCPVCGGKFKTYNKYKHDQSAKHQAAEKVLKAKDELKKREEEEAAAQAKALAEADAKRNKRTIRIKKKKVEAKVEEKKEEEKPKPKPKIKIAKKKEENIKMEIKEKPKAAALKALEEYASSSEDEEKEEEKLEETVFYFQAKEIDSEEVAKYIQEHHEKSAKPERSADSKTPRLNKNASLWRKVSKELDGKKWSYLGEHFGEIVTKAYDKPSSQADLVQMLKMVVIHFTKVPIGEQQAISGLARKLKSAHIGNQK